MKTPVLYGLLITIAGAVIILLQFFLGFHSDPAKFATGQKIGFISLPITITLLVFGIRARFAETPPHEAFSFGKAVGTGTLIGLFTGLFSAIFYFVYGSFINPAFHDIIFQTQMEAVESRGGPVPPENLMRFFTGPVWTALMTFIFSIIMCTLASLVIGIFVKRPALEPAPIES